jgi:hypothetical protein
MALPPRKTYPELAELVAPVVDSDVLAVYRDPGPLKRIPASDFLDYIETGIQPLVDDAEAAKVAAELAETNSEAAATASLGYSAASAISANSAADSASQALNARLAAGFYPSARSNVPRGITGTSGLVAGSGGTNGTFDLSFAGGNFSTNPSGTFTVAGGVLTSVTITGPGLYIGASPSAPTAVLTASAGLTSASVTLTVGFLINSGEFYWTDDATSTNLMALYQNVSGTATATSPLVNLTKSLTAGIVPCTVSAPNARSYPMTPVTGFAVTGTGTNQLFFGIAGATNGEGQLGSIVTATITGVFSGAATEIVLPNGASLPAGAIQLDSPFIIQPSSTRGKYVLVSPSYVVQPTFVQLAWVSGTGNTIVAKLPFAETKIPADLANVRMVFQTQGDKPFGSASLTIRNFADTADVLPATAIYDATDTTAITAAGAWTNKQTIEVTRNVSGRLNLVSYPSSTLTIATEQDAALALQLPTVLAPVFAQKLTDKTWLVELEAVQYDDTSLVTSKKMNQDTHSIIMYDMGRAMSAGVLQNAYAPAVNSQKASIGGKDFWYSWLYSDEGGGGSFLGDQPSTSEFAMRVGLFADSSSTYDFYGLGHGLVQMISSTLSMDGGADQKASPVGTRLRGSSLVWTTLYDAYRPPLLTPSRIGQVTITQTLDANGVTVLHTHKIGRTMAYTSGSSQIAEGVTINGQTSGATAVVVVFPSATTGTFGGGNAAGELYVKSVTGTFQNGENLRVATSVFGVMSGTVGGQIGIADSYSAMLPTTTINRMKVAGSPEIVIGYQDNAQQPPSGTWTGTDRMQVRHGTVDTDIILEMLLLGSYPFNPPGDYSLAATTQMFAQDRSEGNRKMYVNWVSGTKQVYEGTYTGQQRYRFRVGAMV